MNFNAPWRTNASQSQPATAPKPSSPRSLEHAITEIAARQRALHEANSTQEYREQPESVAAASRPKSPAGSAATAATTALDSTPAPAPDLSGLEKQLRKIADQIETLRDPGTEKVIGALRTELGNIGRALNDAMPRHAIQTVENQIQDIDRRLAEDRQAGVDAGVLSGTEYGLVAVRDALHGLMPAEKLAGFHQAINNLAQKIDLIVAQNDPATLRQLENTVTTLRYMVDHVASSEVVNQLATHVEMLADKIDHIARTNAGGGALANLAHRVDALTDKIDQLQTSRGDNLARRPLEDHIVALVERLDACTSHLSHLDAIERGIADLLIHIEELRASKNAAECADLSPAVDELKHEFARTQDRLDVVDGTLGQLLERLATIEQDTQSREDVPPIEHVDAREFTGSADKVQVRLASDVSIMAPESEYPELAVPSFSAIAAVSVERDAAPVAAVTEERAAQIPLAPSQMPPLSWKTDTYAVSPDQPLEPGSRSPDLRANPAVRIAASQAALGVVQPAPETVASSRSSFIAAARRAAQAAAQQRGSSTRSAASGATSKSSPGTKVAKRVKALLIAASIVAIVVGSLRIAGGEFGFELGGPGHKIAQRHKIKGHDEIVALLHRLRAGHSEKIAATPKAKPQAPVELAAEPAHQTLASAINPPAQPGPIPQLASVPPAQINLASRATSPVSPPLPAAEITDSIPHATASKRPERRPAQAARYGEEQLPTSIGAPQLRKAALTGNAAAAYEVALRFEQGRGVPVNLEAAAHWFKQAASKGLAPAQFRYASMLEKGHGVRKDLNAARRLYLAAAKQGNAKAMHNLAVLYAEGVDGNPDYAVAAKWFTQAAQHGVSDSQYNLGILYARGIGVSKNLSESFKWFALAATHGDKEAAKKRDEIAARLDPKELAHARQAVAKFVVTPEPRSATFVAEPPGGRSRPAAISTRS